MKQLLVLTALALCAGFASVPAAYADFGVSVVFSDQEIRIIESWYRDPDHHPRGKDKALPPGIAKNLARGKPLPPGIAKQQLPEDLTRALPAPPRGYERVIVDGRILLVEIATQVIHDILLDAVYR